MPRVLLVEDDPALAVALKDGFTYEGYEVELATDGSAGQRFATEGNPDVIVLDLMLPKVDGLEVCRRLRAESIVPIIILTARDDEVDKVLGLELGADDYMTKPFSFLELMARVEAVLRRASGYDGTPECYQFGDVRIDFKKMETRKGSKRVRLSHREFDLLKFMIDHRGEVLPRERILSAVWGYENGSLTRTVDMHVAKLRKKIEDRPQDPTFIVTVHRVGYKFAG